MSQHLKPLCRPSDKDRKTMTGKPGSGAAMPANPGRPPLGRSSVPLRSLDLAHLPPAKQEAKRQKRGTAALLEFEVLQPVRCSRSAPQAPCLLIPDCASLTSPISTPSGARGRYCRHTARKTSQMAEEPDVPSRFIMAQTPFDTEAFARMFVSKASELQ